MQVIVMAVVNNFLKIYFMIALQRFLVHPVTIGLLFCCLIISGESIGGFYILYLFIGLPHGVLHSFLGTAGILFLIASAFFQKVLVVALLRLAASLCFIVSLIRFFTQPGASYNYSTFHQSVPMLVLIVFIIALSLFVYKQLQLLRLIKQQPASTV